MGVPCHCNFAGVFVEPGASAIKSIGRNLKVATTLDMRDAANIFCSDSSSIHCQLGLKVVLKQVNQKVDQQINLKVEGVRML